MYMLQQLLSVSSKFKSAVFLSNAVLNSQLLLSPTGIIFTTQALKLSPQGSPVIDLGKEAWIPAYFESSFLLFMSANGFIINQWDCILQNTMTSVVTQLHSNKQNTNVTMAHVERTSGKEKVCVL